MTYKEIQEFLAEVNTWGNISTLKDKNKIDKIYFVYSQIFRDEFKEGCSNCFVDCLMVIYRLTEQKATDLHELTFKLHPSRYLFDPKIGHATMTINANLTNAKALWHLRLYPANIGKFSQKPENWEELIKDTEIGEFPTLIKKQTNDIIKPKNKTKNRANR